MTYLYGKFALNYPHITLYQRCPEQLSELTDIIVLVSPLPLPLPPPSLIQGVYCPRGVSSGPTTRVRTSEVHRSCVHILRCSCIDCASRSKTLQFESVGGSSNWNHRDNELCHLTEACTFGWLVFLLFFNLQDDYWEIWRWHNHFIKVCSLSICSVYLVCAPVIWLICSLRYAVFACLFQEIETSWSHPPTNWPQFYPLSRSEFEVTVWNAASSSQRRWAYSMWFLLVSFAQGQIYSVSLSQDSADDFGTWMTFATVSCPSAYTYALCEQ